jgi:hypothetical protein
MGFDGRCAPAVQLSVENEDNHSNREKRSRQQTLSHALKKTPSFSTFGYLGGKRMRLLVGLFFLGMLLVAQNGEV